jgi:hypothetical protein
LTWRIQRLILRNPMQANANVGMSVINNFLFMPFS